MYEYEYVTVTAEGGAATKFKEHREIIDRRAKEGWRYAGWIPAHSTNNGTVVQIDLIFEREAQ